jgi:2'-5' RNA ligase
MGADAMDAKPASTRLFLALWPDPAVRALLEAWRDAWSWPRGASPVRSEKLHVTLHFLGNLPAERLPDLIDGLAVPLTPFALRFQRAALWHNGVAVLEPETEPPELQGLHARLSQALLGLGLQPEARKYRPHVTMARRANGAAIPQHGPVVDWAIDHYALVESRPENGNNAGGGYTVLREYR